MAASETDSMLSASEIRAQVARYDQEIAGLSAALRDAEDVRRSLLITGSNHELALHDKDMDQTRLGIERAAARAEAFRAKLPATEEREELDRQARVHARIVDRSARYQELVEIAYPQAAGPLIELLAQMRELGAEIEALNRSVPAGLRIRPEDFRLDPRSSRYFAPVFEGVQLPAVRQVEAALWPLPSAPVERRASVERPPAKIDEFSKLAVISDGRLDPGGIRYERQDLSEWMRERDARLAAEERAKTEAGR